MLLRQLFDFEVFRQAVAGTHRHLPAAIYLAQFVPEQLANAGYVVAVIAVCYLRYGKPGLHRAYSVRGLWPSRITPVATAFA